MQRKLFDGDYVIVVTSMMGCTDGVTKISKVASGETKTRPKHVVIWSRLEMDGLTKTYDEI